VRRDDNSQLLERKGKTVKGAVVFAAESKNAQSRDGKKWALVLSV